MKTLSARLAVILVFLSWASVTRAQTADEVLEKSLTALGGRAALGKLTSRSEIGTISLSTPAGEIAGTIELLNAKPNKSRTLVKADLSALGAGELVIDTRFDGNTGYAMDSLQGNRDVTGNQLDNLRNSSFPHPFLTYKAIGTAAQLGSKEKAGDRDAYVVIFEPTSGSTVRAFIDAETYLPIKTVLKVEVPQVGQTVEQSTEFQDYREVDGVKVPFRLVSTSSLQNYTITFTKVEHNVQVDEALFAKPKQ